MYLEILNCGAKRREAIAKAVPIFFEKLFGGDPEITVTIQYKLKTDAPEDGFDTHLIPTRDDRGKLTQFKINVYGEKAIPADLQAIAHECVHIWHFVSGALRLLPNTTTKRRWDNVTYDMNEMSYWDLPWEIDAYGREVSLMAHLSDRYPELTPRTLRERC